MSFVTELMNPFIVVRNKIRTPQGAWVDQIKKRETMHGSTGSNIPMNPTINHQVINTYGRKTIIESFVIADTSNVNIGVHVSDAGSAWDNNIALLLDFNPVDGSNSYRRGLSGDAIGVLGSDLFDVLNENVEINGTTMALKRPIEFPNGVRVNFYGGSYTREGNLTYKIFWKEIEE